MKFSATIFVEGKADVKFIHDFVLNSFNYQLTKDQIKIVNGKDNLQNFTPQFLTSSEQNFINLLIFDADNSFIERSAELESKRQELGIEFELFLFPNNSDEGDLEALLERIVCNGNEAIFNCFDLYNDCIGRISHVQIERLNRKTKIYNYVSVLAGADAAKEDKRDYSNQKHWDLESTHLQPLKMFLQPYFSKL